ncbi:hypothetical protein PCA31118_01651 [Pandoraea captiosa]|uniref:Uncharacterized protein n=1 Tax=Pandoraea captiosa TaxID=2508302 RepID=A0A5E4ZWC8_9BURK|nr:hypothetical protein [Pandoraea captiosa]VVE64575.1 hypothetical protein PCA31118_01651 [Pandoraea captiosa]
MTKSEEMLRLIRRYKETTGETEVDMNKVAKFAHANGWPVPKPKDPMALLAREFTQAARQEFRKDAKTGRPYRVNHALYQTHGTQQMVLWVDIDEATRPQMHKSLINRREQMIGDGLQLTLDSDHWNSIHPEEEPITIPMDFTEDIEWRKNAPDEEDEAA